VPKFASPRIFATLAAPTLAGMEAQAADVAGSQIGVEFRFDYLQEWGDFEADLHQMLTRLRAPHAIATCRRVKAGGLFPGSVDEQIERLHSAVRAGCERVDLEVESVERAGPQTLDRLRPAKIIVSHHDYAETPPLAPIYRKLARLPADYWKIATFARTLQDNLRIAELLRAHGRDGKLVAHAMGPGGLPSRLLSLKWGSPFTYGSAGAPPAVAPGQLPAEGLRSIYRVDRVDSCTALYGVVGSRASISLSPVMHNSALHAKQVNALYLPCETSRLDDFLTLARRLEMSGFSVTMPFKTSIIRELDWVEPMAAEIQACNTVAVQHGKWKGWNTDAAAVVEVLSKRMRLAGSEVLVLGAGGAARAAVYGLRAEGVELTVMARREASARELAQSVSARVAPWGSTDGIDVDAVINATPVGMSPHVDAMPVDLARVRTRVVLEMVYHPLETRFLAAARHRGLVAISGLEMLVAQGARQFEIWTGEPAPHALMEQAALQALGHGTG
jgi:3-dehydroquinate dehydratase/shikimate dehydrogenase